MKVFNVFFMNGDMFTTSGKEESDALMELFNRHQHLDSDMMDRIELNRGCDESID